MAFNTINLICLAGLVTICNAGCVMTRKADTKGVQSSQTGFKVVSTEQECSDFCRDSSSCLQADFRGTSCKIYDTQTMEISEVGTVQMKKICNPCSMTQTANSKGVATTLVQLTLTGIDDCSTACQYITQCTAVTYSASTCSVYGSTASTSNTGDLLHRVKQMCTDTGKTCCMEATSTLKANAVPLLTLTSSVESCEAVCMAASNCMSVHFKNNICYVYTNATTATTEVGSIYSTKTCTGIPTSTLDVTTTCAAENGSMTMLLNIHLVAVLTFLSSVWLL